MDASPEEKSFGAAERFLESRKSARTERWLQLEEALIEAANEATDRETFLAMGPHHMTPDVPGDFAALCVFSGR